MLLFMVILMLSRVQLRIRQATVFGLMLYCLASGNWAAFEFLAGFFLAEIHILQSVQAKDYESSETATYQQPPRRTAQLLKIVHFAIIAIGLFIGGWPNQDADKTPGIRAFLALTPEPFVKNIDGAAQRFWFGLAAAFMVWSVGALPLLKRFFEGPFAQYCGRISFAMYICHGFGLGLWEKRVLGWQGIPASGEPGTPDYKPGEEAYGVKGYIGCATTTQITASWFVGLCILGPMIVWVADLFWRAVDDPVVRIGKKLEVACLDDAEPSPRAQGYSVAT
jgi:hypothetical protein